MTSLSRCGCLYYRRIIYVRLESESNYLNSESHPVLVRFAEYHQNAERQNFVFAIEYCSVFDLWLLSERELRRLFFVVRIVRRCVRYEYMYCTLYYSIYCTSTVRRSPLFCDAPLNDTLSLAHIAGTAPRLSVFLYFLITTLLFYLFSDNFHI